MGTPVGAENSIGSSVARHAATDGLLGDLWERVLAHGDSFRAEELLRPVPLDTTALRSVLESRETIGPPGSWATADYVEGMSMVEAWEAGLVPGAVSTDPPVTAWVMLHGLSNSERNSRLSVYSRPNLIFSFSGYSALTRTCTAVQVSVSPMRYDEFTKDWGADEECMVTGTERLLPRSLTPPGPEELRALGSLTRVVYAVLDPILPLAATVDMGGGLYQSMYVSRPADTPSS